MSETITPRPLSVEEAENLGRATFRLGLPNLPFANVAIASEMADAQPGEKTDLLRAFNAGWTAANLAAPWL